MFEDSEPKPAKIPRRKLTTSGTKRKRSLPFRADRKYDDSLEGLFQYPQKVLEASRPGPFKEEGSGYDICFVRAAFRQDSHGNRAFTYNEFSPLLRNEAKRGLANEHNTFPKHVYISDTPNELSDSEGTVVSWVPDNTDTLTDPSGVTCDSSNSTENVLPEDKRRTYWKWMCTFFAILLILIAVVMAVALFYLFSSCPSIVPEVNRMQQCSSTYHFNSDCTFTCDPGFVLKGPSMITCGFHRSWSAPIPTCQCPECHEGTQCQYSINWNDVASQVSQIVPNIDKTIHYGNNSMSCRAKVNSSALLFSCQCVDYNLRASRNCTNRESLVSSCLHATANLINDGVKSGKYPLPCDVKNMKSFLGCPNHTRFV